jgi:hypothetical protein
MHKNISLDKYSYAYVKLKKPNIFEEVVDEDCTNTLMQNRFKS